MFFFLAVVWLLAGTFYVHRSILEGRSESSCFIQLGRASATLGIEYARGGPHSLQPFAERIRVEGALAYCAVTDEAFRVIAHSSRDHIGQVWTTPQSHVDVWNDVRRTRFEDANYGRIIEYSTALRMGDDVVGTVHIAVAEPSISAMAINAASYSQLLLVGPLLLVMSSSYVLRGIVNPLNEIERQLSQMARLPSTMKPQLRPVAMQGLIGLGWNRLAAALPQSKEMSTIACDDQMSERLSRQQSAVLTCLPDGVAITDADGVITFANLAMASLLRAGEPVSLVGQTMEASVRSHWLLAADHPLLDEEAHDRAIVTEVENAEESPFSVLRIARNPMRAEGSGDVWTVRDITQQKLAEQARTKFVDTATHELRTPLANIKAYAETLALAEITDPEQQKQFLNTINGEATRLARFVDDLLSVSSMEVGTLTIHSQETDLARLFDDVIDKVRPQLDQKRIRLATSFPEKLEKATIDKEKMTAALVNLLGNAIKYTSEQGRIALRVESVQDQIQVTLEDTGMGISPEDLPHVFDKFFRSSDPRVQAETGTGLGLSLTREVVRLHGGSMQIQSEINNGTTVTVQFPLGN